MEPLHIFIYNEIGFWGITPDEVQNQLNANADAEEVIVHISSPGGEVFDGWTIGNILGSLDKKVTVKIEGLCASIATYIALQGDTVEMAETGRFMIHNPSTFAEGDSNDMENAKMLLDGITNDLVRVYQEKTGLDEQELRDMMDAETFMTPKEAREKGFVDSIIEGVKAVAFLDKKHINMTPQDKTKANGLFATLENLINKLTNSTPTNVMVELASGGQIFVESEDGDLTGKSAFTVDEEGERTDTPAPDGDHELVDGRVLVVEDGVVSEVREGSDTEAALRTQVAELTKQLDAAQQENERITSENETNIEAIVQEINALKELTVGGTFQVPKAHTGPVPKPGAQPKEKSTLGNWASKLPVNELLQRK